MSPQATATLRRRAERRTVHDYLRALAATAPRAFGIAIALRLCVVVADGLGVLLLLPLLRIAGVDGGTSSLREWEAGLDGLFGAFGPSFAAPLALGSYALVIAIGAILQRQSVVTTMELQEDFLLRLRTRLFRAITRAQWKFLSTCRGSELTHTLSAELERVGPATYQLLNVLSAAAGGTVFLFIAFQLSYPITLLAVGCGGFLLVSVRRKRRDARVAGQTLTDMTSDLFTAAAEHVGSLKTAIICGAEGRSTTRFAAFSSRVATLNVQTERLHADGDLVLEIGSVLALCAALYLGLAELHLDAATLLVLLYVFSRVTPRLISLQGSAQNFLLAMPAFASVLATLRRCEQEAASRSEDPAPTFQRWITLESVRFHYPGRGDTAALKDVDLCIEAGRTTAIVGPSGGGKSTVADLVMGLLSPDGGAVRVDGVSLTSARARRWRESIGYVTQDVVLLHDTIRANLLWAAPEADETDLMRALALASADEFVNQLPQGLETIVGDRGAALSGGERQRLALARALVRKPSLLILDEATSAIDAENEARIQRAVESLQGQTILLITHRLATVRLADLIYVVEQGRVVEQGAWDDLFGRGGRFAALCAAQGWSTDRRLAVY